VRAIIVASCVVAVDVTAIPIAIERCTYTIEDGRHLLRNERALFEVTHSVKESMMGMVYCGRVLQWPGGMAGPGSRVAIKALDRKCIDKRKTLDGHPIAEDVWTEVRVQQYLTHPPHDNVCRLFAVLQDENLTYIIMEYGTGEWLRCW
jgi:hypothetical protein